MTEVTRHCLYCGTSFTVDSQQQRKMYCCKDHGKLFRGLAFRCLECGGPRSEGSVRCRRCASSERSEFFAQGANMEKRRKIIDLYRAGMPIKDMARILGLTPGSLALQINRLRKYGYDLPYRRTFTPEGIARMRENGRNRRRRDA